MSRIEEILALADAEEPFMLLRALGFEAKGIVVVDNDYAVIRAWGEALLEMQKVRDQLRYAASVMHAGKMRAQAVSADELADVLGAALARVEGEAER